MGPTAPHELLDSVASAAIIADAADPGSVGRLLAAFRRLAQSLPKGDAGRDKVDAALLALEKAQAADNPTLNALLVTTCSTVAELQRMIREPETGKPAPTTRGVSPPAAGIASEIAVLLEESRPHLEEIEKELLGVESGATKSVSGLQPRFAAIRAQAAASRVTAVIEVCDTTDGLFRAGLDLDDLGDRLLMARDWITHTLQAYAKQESPPHTAAQVIAKLTRGVAGLLPLLCSPPSAAQSAVPTSAPNPEAPPQTPPPSQGDAPDVAKVWDAETTSLLGDFLQESREGLAQVDEVLLACNQLAATKDQVNLLFRVFHTIKGVSSFLSVDQVTTLAHTTETLLNKAREGAIVLQGATLELVLESTGLMRQLLDETERAVTKGQVFRTLPGLDDLLQKLRKASGTELVTAGAPQAPIAPVTPVAAPAAKLAAAPVAAPVSAPVAPSAAPAPPPESQPTGGGSVIKETVKVDVARVDSLVEMIGELVIVESMVTHAPEIAGQTSVRLRTYLGQLGKITRDLQDIGMRMRMVPVRGAFNKMARMVHDLSRRAGKDVRLEISGEATEMDRSMVEQVSDPLVHMVRNAIDHGIEPADARARAGKTAHGQIRLLAYHQGSSIVIEVSDDGRGIDKNRVLAKAIEKGLVTRDAKLSDNDIYNLVFAPGFSTAEQVTEISGRGVGMDVVKRSVDAMRGRVVITTKLGEGTSFKLILPLTLAIIDGMIVTCGSERYILPTLSIVESLRPTADSVKTCSNRGELLDIRGEILPLFRLADLFGIANAESDAGAGQIVVLESVGGRLGLLVDDVLAQQQVVIKSLDAGIANTAFLAGAAILSDGRVGLILNVDEVCSLAQSGRSRMARGHGDLPSPQPPQPPGRGDLSALHQEAP